MESSRTGWNPVMLELFAGRGVPAWVMAGAASIRAQEPIIPVQVDEVVFPVAWLLDRIGPGVTLTKAGYLPTAVVRDALTSGVADPIASGQRELDVWEVSTLRTLCTTSRLLRRAKGMLTVTKLGRRLASDPTALWWHLADSLPIEADPFSRHQAGLELLSHLVPMTDDEATPSEFRPAADLDRERRLKEALGMCWAFADGRPVGPQWTDTSATLRLLGLSTRHSMPRGHAPVGEAAAIAFARAALTRPAVPVPDQTSRGPVDALEVLVSLDGTDPGVWRRLVVPESISLGRLHGVLQGAMGWTDSHLHMFRVGDRMIGPVDLDLGEPTDDEAEVTLGSVGRPGTSIGYEYDFGDSWEHRIEVLRALAGYSGPTPAVVAGERACPPEDVGGIGGHEQLCAVLAGHADRVGIDPDQAAEMVTWAPTGYDPSRFDADEANARIALALSDNELTRLQRAIEQR